MTNRKKAFSLIELLISLIVISCITAAFTPVITKKLNHTSVSLNAGSSEITTKCQDKFSNSCKLCTKSYCIQCELNSCSEGTYVESKTCTCKNCGDAFENCKKCTISACLECNNQNYYISEGKCAACPVDKICDGINAYDKEYCSNPPAGYYCSGNAIKKCIDTYPSSCKSCNSSGCTSCNNHYYLSNGECKPCASKCLKCTDGNNCTQCQNGYILNSANHTCTQTCWSAMPNCSYCDSATLCTTCFGGYYINSSKKCSPCSDIPHCLLCQNASNCNKCEPGYYVNSENRCSKCNIQNCAQCDRDGTCLSCNQGYFVSEDKKSCTNNNNKFKCSDGNFMQIGNLCVTRKNMGDSSVLPIPNTVTIAQAKNDYCYSDISRCCWKGNTAGSVCDSNFGGYDGCSRTVCNFDAAKEICANFSYGGKQWRLPTEEELASWDKFSIGLDKNGLMLCDLNQAVASPICLNGTGSCFGAYNNDCIAREIWSSTINANGLSAAAYYLSTGNFHKAFAIFPYAFSVRCVTEIE